jgi:hypothetical protein
LYAEMSAAGVKSTSVIAPHVVHHGPVAGPPSDARVSAAVARLLRLHAFAGRDLEVVVGPCVVEAFARRVEAIGTASATGALGDELHRRAVRAHTLATWVAAVAEAIEAESDTAAKLRVDLAAIITECEFIIAGSAPASVAA